MKHANPRAGLLLSVAASLLMTFSQPVHGQQEVCTGPLSDTDVFSVGEIRTSILPQQKFQELNGAEWVLLDGRPLMVNTALSPYITEEGLQGSQIPLARVPDARGRFLRMANNRACANLRDDQNEETYNDCLAGAGRDPDGDRMIGAYQADSFAQHGHGEHSHDFGYIGAREVRPDGDDDDNDDIRARKRERTGETGQSEIPVNGGKETRPKNIAVNYFIKICYCRTTVCK